MISPISTNSSYFVITREHRLIFRLYREVVNYIEHGDDLGLRQICDETRDNHGEFGVNLIWQMLNTKEKQQMRDLLQVVNFNQGEQQ